MGARDEHGFTGTKDGCGIASAAACTSSMRHRSGLAATCRRRHGKEVTTSEGLPGRAAEAVKRVECAGRPQCGYCQSGQMMSATALLIGHPCRPMRT